MSVSRLPALIVVTFCACRPNCECQQLKLGDQLLGVRSVERVAAAVALVDRLLQWTVDGKCHAHSMVEPPVANPSRS